MLSIMYDLVACISILDNGLALPTASGELELGRQMQTEVDGDIGKFAWEVAVCRIGQLASEIGIPMQSLSLGGSNGCADELTNWDGTKKRRCGR